jgi:hypothetical protein
MGKAAADNMGNDFFWLKGRTVWFAAALWAAVLVASQAQDPGEVVIPIDSNAFVFSPGNWTGDFGRTGRDFRQTWNSGAYFHVGWTTTSAVPSAELILDATYPDKLSPPLLTYCIDGVWTEAVPCASRVPINGLKGAGPHVLTVYVQSSEQTQRWGSAGQAGENCVKIQGLAVDASGVAQPATPLSRWALMVGDSITEGISAGPHGADNLACWSYFVGQGLQALGYDYDVSACGYSGWLRPGDKEGDVPPYYLISQGTYDDAHSRWNKIDARTSLLDTAGHLSAYGATGQEPALIILNMGTNDGLKKVNGENLSQSISEGLAALQKAAPSAKIFVVIPFGQYEADLLKKGVQSCMAQNPTAPKIEIIDLGPAVANALEDKKYWGALHPNIRGHATLAARILAQIVSDLPGKDAAP